MRVLWRLRPDDAEVVVGGGGGFDSTEVASANPIFTLLKEREEFPLLLGEQFD